MVTYGHISTLEVIFLPICRTYVCISAKLITVAGLHDIDDIFKVIGSQVKVTENLSGGGIPTDRHRQLAVEEPPSYSYLFS